MEMLEYYSEHLSFKWSKENVTGKIHSLIPKKLIAGHVQGTVLGPTGDRM